MVSLNSRKVLCILTRTSEDDFLLGILLVEASFIFFSRIATIMTNLGLYKTNPSTSKYSYTHTHILYRHIIEQQGTAYSFKRSERNNHIFYYQSNIFWFSSVSSAPESYFCFQQGFTWYRLILTSFPPRAQGLAKRSSCGSDLNLTYP